MFKFFLFFTISVFLSFKIVIARTWITEVQPFKIEEEEEWFEFLVEENNPIDIGGWKISNGKTKKTIKDVRNKLIFNSEELLTGSGSSAGDLIFKENQKHYFSWEKSPVSLSNSGGIVQILNNKEEILSEFIYPKGKYGTRASYKYSEIFNWDFSLNRIYPLIFRKNYGNGFTHTKGYENQKSPVFAEDVVILISEISMNRDKEKGGDFIEIYFKEGPSKINLKYCEIKYNGTSLYFFENDFWVSPKQFLTIWVGKNFSGIVKNTAPYEIFSSKKDGLSAGSGTIELILMSDTSYETTEDFACYMDKKLSKTEQNRVDKNLENWAGSCFDISDIIPNQSIARTSNWHDSNSKSDFFNHFNGTPNMKNILINEEPKAIITIQGSGKIKGKPPFSVNLTGENSLDPDGKKDIKTFTWRLDGEIFSRKENPKLFKLEKVGVYEVSLEITDFSGETDKALQIFSVVSTGGAVKLEQSKKGKEFIKEILSTRKEENHKKDFFSDFLEKTPDNFWENIQNLPEQKSSFDPRGDEIKKIIDIKKKKQEKRKKWIAKNIAWVFVEGKFD